MKGLVRTLSVLISSLAFVIPAHSQTVCAGNMAININCGGQNNCNQSVAVVRPNFSSAPTCMTQRFIWCCDTQELDYNASDESCSVFCDDAVSTLLKDPYASEFALTHTLWVKDCSGHYRPFALSWDAPEKPIDIRPRRALSGIGG